MNRDPLYLPTGGNPEFTVYVQKILTFCTYDCIFIYEIRLESRKKTKS